MGNNYLRDIGDRLEEAKRIDEKFTRLHNRFLAVAMDYKCYINDKLGDAEIFKYRDNVIFRLQSARFHFNLLLQFQDIIETNLKKISPIENRIEFHTYQTQAAEEIYSLFDSMVYHICSIFDYLFSLINFIHGKSELNNPKWNLFKHDKNIKKNMYCSSQMIESLEKIDSAFVYPLIKHRSHLIHTEHSVGNIHFSYENNKVRFLVTDTLKGHFPDFTKENGNIPTTLAFAAKWLIDKSFKSITEVLFETKDDMIRNKKVEIPPFFIWEDNTVKEPSMYYWGNRQHI
ncbi:hypothetical protein [Chryseobacterium luteum]|uniref:Cthe-2314-like HEPN domain-containing protein n=1 Tax=Chryseobacterium luteum TaxID=421531 RepID=A0A085YY09_9FLAO|nr:hypothetical protein [Chryseobacterium luteum]KFE97072.1 hypothetical protein IX38_21655 [Chryseobacterium luteum]